MLVVNELSESIKRIEIHPKKTEIRRQDSEDRLKVDSQDSLSSILDHRFR